jgi:hypothetical protein
LPDETFARAKKLREEREISFAELARRGIEYLLSVYAPGPAAARAWEPRGRGSSGGRDWTMPR